MTVAQQAKQAMQQMHRSFIAQRKAEALREAARRNLQAHCAQKGA